MEAFSTQELANTLQEFYCCVRKQPNKEGKAEEYGHASYLNIRAGLQRYLVGPPNNKQIDIRQDREFQSANQVFLGKLKQMRHEGRDITKHKSAINPDDITKMYSSGTLNNDNPTNLQMKVFFEISLHFGRRGREGWRQLTKQSFALKVDPSGREYLTIIYNEYDKNHQNDECKKQMMFSQPDDPNCPIKSYKKYVSKLHPNFNVFLQRLNPKFAEQPNWYIKAPLGVHTIGTMMRNISALSNTSEVYTNHCIRATTTTALKRAGCQPTDIMAVTGHRNMASLNSYASEPTPDEWANMSNILAKYGNQGSTANIDDPTSMIVAIPKSDGPTATTSLATITVSNQMQAFKSIFSGAIFQGPVTINVNVADNAEK